MPSVTVVQGCDLQACYLHCSVFTYTVARLIEQVFSRVNGADDLIFQNHEAVHSPEICMRPRVTDG